MPKPNDVTVTIGEVVIDWISTEVGVDVGNAVNFGRFIGGNAVNVSTALARLGRQARLVGKIGADFHSLLLKERLSREK
ncbi:MAG TPA: PfkB family carbohydrate kinase, partial [Chroococcales cyanobacterium]